MSGPTLPPTALPKLVTPFPPVAAGDLIALGDRTPCTIVLIDGVFEAQAAPWHKELLDLMARGFRLIGASSMGALRAAELFPYGMIGVGSVYRAFAAGRLVADDEVAVLHAPAELGWRPLTDAMVDIRATLCRAVAGKVVSTTDARCLRDAALRTNFRDRRWELVLDGAIGGPALEPLRDWLPAGRISIKRIDATEAVGRGVALRLIPAPLGPPPPETLALRRLRANVHHANASASPA